MKLGRKLILNAAPATSVVVAIHFDPSYRSWQGAASVLESFNGSNGSAVESAAINLMSYCAKLHK